MIEETHFRTTRKNYFCSNPKAIENYGFAISDEKHMWECHHRLETHFSDGTERPRDAQLSQAELIALGMYYNRPPKELIFLTKSEHRKLHAKNIGVPKTKEHKNKLSKALKNRTDLNRDHSSGRHWYTNGYINVFEYKCPPGFIEGLVDSDGRKKKGKTFTEDHKRKISEWNKNHKEERSKAISAGKCKYLYIKIDTGETHTMPEWRDMGFRVNLREFTRTLK